MIYECDKVKKVDGDDWEDVIWEWACRGERLKTGLLCCFVWCSSVSDANQAASATRRQHGARHEANIRLDPVIVQKLTMAMTKSCKHGTTDQRYWP